MIWIEVFLLTALWLVFGIATAYFVKDGVTQNRWVRLLAFLFGFVVLPVTFVLAIIYYLSLAAFRGVKDMLFDMEEESK